jgi:uncharacterized protein YhhL (DUF1145 family)
MKEILTITYLVIGFIFTTVFLWGIYSKKRKLDWLTLLHVVTMLFVSTAAGCILMASLKDSIHFSWVSRLVLFGIGFMLSWGVYQVAWSQRYTFDYQRDSFETEFCFVAGLAAFMGLLYLKVPTWWSANPVLHWEKDYWDVGLILIVPFLLHKTWDAFTQIEYVEPKNPENRWNFPANMEHRRNFPDRFVNTQHWKWHNSGPISFQMAKNLNSEYNWFTKPVDSGMEVPKDQPIGATFAFLIQERRKDPTLVAIDDLGNEYGGQPRFWLLFSIKKVWWKPSTWNQTNRYLYPELSIVQNAVHPNDIIVVQRIPFLPMHRRSNSMYAPPAYDSGKTEIITR